MKLVESMDALLHEASATAKWRKPTREELGKEFDTEPDINLTIGQASWVDKGVYDDTNKREFWLRVAPKLARVVEYKKPPRIEYWAAPSIEDLAKMTAHMRKDPAALAAAMESGAALPYPLILKSGSKLKLLGGRTRFGVAAILGQPVKAWVIDAKDLRKADKEFMLDAFINNPQSSFAKDFTAKQRQEFLNWVLGGRKGTAPVTHRHGVDFMVDLFADEIEKKLG